MKRGGPWTLAWALYSFAALALGSSGFTYSRWRVRPVTEVSVAQHPIESKAARFTTDNGTLVLNVTHLEFPHIDGRVAESRGAALVALDLRSVQDAQAVTRDPVSRGIQRKSLPLDPDTLRGAISTSVRFRTMAGPVQMELRGVDPPWVYGIHEEGNGYVRIDLRDVRTLEIREHGVKWVTVVVGTFFLLLLVAASLPGAGGLRTAAGSVGRAPAGR
jgi:hypothetical protein